MMRAVYLLAGVAIGWALPKDYAAWIAVACAATWGGLVVGIFIATDFALRVYGRPGR